MVLTPHLLIGAAIGSKFEKTRWLVFLIIASLFSHYLLDTIPHAEYNVDALADGFNFNFAVAGLKVFWDLFIGLSAVFFLSQKKRNLYFILIGAIAAILPDVIIFMSWQIDNLNFLNYLVALGHKIHYPENSSVALPIGLMTQIIVSFIAVIILRSKSLLKTTTIRKK
ncbi:MAG: hypothetical protein LiPW39_20 [Parcubacteria group bacterium LiPW_39]|nr:MAG: hypothetical protein LiPW39_20 [Parcubacteria group bacterium LiPW_39]